MVINSMFTRSRSVVPRWARQKVSGTGASDGFRDLRRGLLSEASTYMNRTEGRLFGDRPSLLRTEGQEFF